MLVLHYRMMETFGISNIYINQILLELPTEKSKIQIDLFLVTWL